MVGLFHSQVMSDTECETSLIGSLLPVQHEAFNC